MTTTLSIRPAAVAGSFYPAEPGELRAAVRRFLEQPAPGRKDSAAGGTGVSPVVGPQGQITKQETGGTPVPPEHTSAIKAIIGPHAGYVFSGAVAGSVYRLLEPLRGKVSRVVVMGPAHRVAMAGLACSTASHFATPLGDVPVDRAAIDSLRDLAFVALRDDAHAQEHGIEVHLPFLMETIGSFSLVPLVVGDAPTQQAARVLERLWGGAETLIVVSSDLSHYHDYAEAKKLDAAAARAIEELRPLDLAAEQACGHTPVRALLGLAARHGLRARRLDLRNSADTAPNAAPRNRVVGYGAWVFEEEKGLGIRDQGLGEERKKTGSAGSSSARGPDPRALGLALLSVARQSIAHGLATGRPLAVAVGDFDPALREMRATFVTLHARRADGKENLRGCIGTLEARRAMVEDVAQNAFAAAFRDPRFPPVTSGEAAGLEIHLSLLTRPEEMRFTSEEDLLAQIEPNVDGLILEDTRLKRRGTFLPAVWESLPDKKRFLEHLKLKAGLPVTHWSDTMRVWRYQAESVGE